MITQIIWLLTWPLLITISWFAIKWVLKNSGDNKDSAEVKNTPEWQE